MKRFSAAPCLAELWEQRSPSLAAGDFIRGVLMMKIVDISSVFGQTNLSLSPPPPPSLPPSSLSPLFVPGAAGAVDGAAGGVGRRPDPLCLSSSSSDGGGGSGGGSEKAAQPIEEGARRTMTFLALHWGREVTRQDSALPRAAAKSHSVGRSVSLLRFERPSLYVISKGCPD